tara:strand:+ start:66 stop:464 length:399 start_codon:yes stop_codon:yes gene_type:complete
MKKIIFLVLFFSISSNAQMSLKDYAEMHFDLDFDKIDESSMRHIVKKCHAVGRIAAEIGISGGNNVRLKYEEIMLNVYEARHPTRSIIEHFELISKETEPLYIEYINYYNRNKKIPDLIISDYSFCSSIIEV